jgi:glutathione S-transferase
MHRHDGDRNSTINCNQDKSMPYVVLVTVIALLQYFYFGFRVSRARGRYNVPAPAMSGHEVFERHVRVQMNTLEQLVIFIPALWLFAHFISPTWASGFGVVFVIGRGLYAMSYVQDPQRRALGFALTALPNLAMAIWLAVWAIGAIAKGAA